MKTSTKIAAEALVAAIQFSNEVISVVDLTKMGFPISQLNRTATVDGMRARLAAMQRFVDVLDSSDFPE